MRTLVAAVLVLGALAAALLGWGLSGWAAVEQERTTLEAEARVAARSHARAVADLAAARLEALRHAESARPYFHYQNLFHDPRGSDEAVVPSPLAAGPDDPQILGHFQLATSAAGGQPRVSMPTLNDDVPELVAADRRDVDLALRARLGVRAPALLALAPPAMSVADVDATQVASTEPVRIRTRPPATSAQTIELSPAQYAQNIAPNEVYQQTRGAQRSQVVPPRPPAAAPVAHTARTTERTALRTTTATTTTITITVPPLSWATLTDADGAADAVALRRVELPDATLVQGFMVDLAELRAALADAGGAEDERVDHPSTLVARAEVPPGEPVIELPLRDLPWVVPIEEDAYLARIAPTVAALRPAFARRFVPIAVLAALCGALVVVLVARAERLARTRAQFAAAAAHELRTPLAGLQLYGDMLAGGLGDPGKAATYAGRIAEDAARLGRVVANVLGFSQLERGNLSVRPRDGDLAAAVRATVERLRPALARTGAELALVAPAPVPARFDEDAVDRVVANLVDNAEKYGRAGADRRVVVTVVATAAGPTVEVRDHGPGVPPVAARRLFRPFSRGGDADAPSGLGLGLSLSRALARAMGGELGHRPAPGGGAAFTLRLPPAA
ncbi:MAG: HAMP domain-containing sensor histidine kinase [Kofleriaceae bacterium]